MRSKTMLDVSRSPSKKSIKRSTLDSDRKYKQLSFSYSNSKWPRPLCNFEFFIEVSQGLLRTAPGLVRTCEIFENWGNPWQSLESLSYPVKDLESLSCPGKDLSPLECQYGYHKHFFQISYMYVT